MDIEVQLQAVGESKMDIEVQNIFLKHLKISFGVQTLTFEGCFKTKMTLKNDRLDFISSVFYFERNSMTKQEHQ